MKRILFFTRPLVPPWDEGSKNLAFEIARHSKGDFVFHLLTDQGGKLEKENWKEKKPRLVLEEIFSSGRLNFSAKLALLKKLFSLKKEIDLVHFLFTPRRLTSCFFSWRLKNRPVKSIQTLATLDDKIAADPSLAKKVLFADLIVAQSKHTLKKLKALNLNARLIYPGIDLEKFIPALKDQELMKEMKISPDDFVVLFTGEYDRLEAIDDILAAFQIIWEKNQANNLKIILACRLKTARDRQIKQTTQGQVIQKGWENHFIFLDFAEDMVKLYNLADLNIFPVRKMAGKFDIPLVLIESMACGKTVLVSDLPVLTEVIQDNINGAVIPPASPGELAEKILWLKDNPETNQKLGQTSRQTTQQLFNIKKTAQEYQRVYEQILN